MTSTRWWRYIEPVIGEMTFRDAAKKAGFNQSAFTRWKGGAKADPEFVVKFARAFKLDVLEALVEAEFITPEEAGSSTGSDLLRLHQAAQLMQKSGLDIAAEAAKLELFVGRLAAEHDELAARRSNTRDSDVESLPYAANRRELEPEEGDDDYGPGA